MSAGMNLLSGALQILDERVRQQREGFTNEHDDQHTDGELAEAALAYATLAVIQLIQPDAHQAHDRIPPFSSFFYPTDWAWKPADTPRGNLVKAGALIAAEIDRLARIELRESGALR